MALLLSLALAGKNPECDEPLKVGPCEALIQKFFYDSEKNECEKFDFGGCQANGNNFNTKETCEEKCKLSNCKYYFFFNFASSTCNTADQKNWMLPLMRYVINIIN